MHKPFVNSKKLQQLSDFFNSGKLSILVLQGTSGTAKTYTLTNLCKNYNMNIEYFDDITKLKLLFGTNNIALTDIDDYEIFFNAVKHLLTLKIKCKCVIETRLSISKNYLASIIKTHKKSKKELNEACRTPSSQNADILAENGVMNLIFNKISITKLKKEYPVLDIFDGNLHKLFMQDYKLNKEATVSIYHFLGKLFYGTNTDDRIKEIKALMHLYNKNKVFYAVYDNALEFLNIDEYVQYISFVSEFDNRLFDPFVLYLWLLCADKKKPCRFYQFESNSSFVFDKYKFK